jgi:hypothetical protein
VALIALRVIGLDLDDVGGRRVALPGLRHDIGRTGPGISIDADLSVIHPELDSLNAIRVHGSGLNRKRLADRDCLVEPRAAEGDHGRVSRRRRGWLTELAGRQEKADTDQDPTEFGGYALHVVTL